MASYAAEMTIEERWAVVAYVRALQVSQAAPLDRAPPDERARLEAMPAVAPPPAHGGQMGEGAGEHPGATPTDHKEAP